MNELALFAGAGGGILGGQLLGWRTVCAVEIETYPASVLLAKQNEGLLPPFPIWDDICTFDGKPWRGIVDVVSGGFPCQDISAAGKGKGIEGERSGLWVEMARVIDEVRPRFAFVENSPVLTSRGLGRVLGDLASMGFDARWGVLGAADVGAPHKRDRIWIVAHANSSERHPGIEHPRREKGLHPGQCSKAPGFMANHNSPWKLQQKGHEQKQRGRTGNTSKEIPDTNSISIKRIKPGIAHAQKRAIKSKRSNRSFGDGVRWWAIEPNVGRVADGVAARVDRIKALGNGQVPQCAAEAWRILSAEF